METPTSKLNEFDAFSNDADELLSKWKKKSTKCAWKFPNKIKSLLTFSSSSSSVNRKLAESQIKINESQKRCSMRYILYLPKKKKNPNLHEEIRKRKNEIKIHIENWFEPIWNFEHFIYGNLQLDRLNSLLILRFIMHNQSVYRRRRHSCVYFISLYLVGHLFSKQ